MAIPAKYDFEHAFLEHCGQHRNVAADQGLHLSVTRKTLRQGRVEKIDGVRLLAQLLQIEVSPEKVVDDLAGTGVVGDKRLASGLVGSLGDDFWVVEAVVEPIDKGFVDLHVQVVLRDGAVFAQDPGDDAQVGHSGHGGEADRDAGRLGCVRHGDGLQVADLAVGGELER